jgi:hypothetical protein
MYAINLIERETSKTAVEAYASGFESYEEAKAFGNKYEMEFRSCGWAYVVVLMAQ